MSCHSDLATGEANAASNQSRDLWVTGPAEPGRRAQRAGTAAGSAPVGLDEQVIAVACFAALGARAVAIPVVAYLVASGRMCAPRILTPASSSTVSTSAIVVILSVSLQTSLASF